MAIKTLESAQKIRVGRESGNTTFIFLGLRLHRDSNVQNGSTEIKTNRAVKEK